MKKGNVLLYIFFSPGNIYIYLANGGKRRKTETQQDVSESFFFSHA